MLVLKKYILFKLTKVRFYFSLVISLSLSLSLHFNIFKNNFNNIAYENKRGTFDMLF